MNKKRNKATALIVVIAFLLTAIVPVAALADDAEGLPIIELAKDIPATTAAEWGNSATEFTSPSANGIPIYQWDNDGNVANANVKISGVDATTSVSYTYMTGASLSVIDSTQWTSAQTYNSTAGIQLTAAAPAALVRYESTQGGTTATKYIGVVLTGVAFKAVTIASNPPATNGKVEVDGGTQATLTATVTGTCGTNTDAIVTVPDEQISWGIINGASFVGIAGATGSSFTTPATNTATTYACQINTGATAAHRSNSITVALKGETSNADLTIQNTSISLDSANPTINAIVRNVEAGQPVALSLGIQGANSVVVEANVQADGKVAFVLTPDNVTALKRIMGSRLNVSCSVTATKMDTSTDKLVTITVAPASITLTQDAAYDTLWVTLDLTGLTLSLPNGTDFLTGTVGNAAANATYTWTSSDPDVASVTPDMDDGTPVATVTARTRGTATITLTVTSGTATASATCDVTVTPLSIAPWDASVVQGNRVNLTAMMEGQPATQGTGTWSVTQVPVGTVGDTTLGIANAGNAANPLATTVPANARPGRYNVTYTPTDTTIAPETAYVWVLTPNWRDVSVGGGSAFVPGDTVEITVTTHAPGFSANVSTEGLEFIRVDDPGDLCDENNVIIFSPNCDETSVRYVYRITGAPGTNVKFELTNATLSNGVDDIPWDVVPWIEPIRDTQQSAYSVDILGPHYVTAGANATFTAVVTPPLHQTVPASATYSWSVTDGADNVVLTPSGNTATITARRANTSATIMVSVSGLGSSQPATAMHIVSITAPVIDWPDNPPVTPPTNPPVTSPTAAPTAQPTTGPSNEPTTGPSTGPSSEPTQNPVSPVPDSPVDWEVTENPTVGGDALEGITISTSTGTTPSISDLLTFSDLPSGSQMVITTPSGVVLAWNTPISTGQIVVVRDAEGDIISQSTVVVKGDVLGTGIINLSQVVRLAGAYRGTDPLSGAFLAAGQWTDTGSGSISLTDLVIEARLYREARMRPAR